MDTAVRVMGSLLPLFYLFLVLLPLFTPTLRLLVNTFPRLCDPSLLHLPGVAACPPPEDRISHLIFPALPSRPPPHRTFPTGLQPNIVDRLCPLHLRFTFTQTCLLPCDPRRRENGSLLYVGVVEGRDGGKTIGHFVEEELEEGRPELMHIMIHSCLRIHGGTSCPQKLKQP